MTSERVGRKQQQLKRSRLERGEKRLERRTSLRQKRSGPTRQWMAIRERCLERAEGQCEARIEAVCAGRASHAHHVLPRGRGGKDHLDNLIAVCALCHDHVHAYPAWAETAGFLKKREVA